MEIILIVIDYSNLFTCNGTTTGIGLYNYYVADLVVLAHTSYLCEYIDRNYLF